MSLADLFDDGVFFAVLGFVFAVLVGVFLGFAAGKSQAAIFNDRETLRVECVGGNQNACRLYEVDYSR